MNFDHDIGQISSILELDLTTGMGTNTLVLTGTGSLLLPSGSTAERPSSATNGMLRYNSDLAAMESFEGGSWVTVGAGGTVTSVSIASDSAALTVVSGSPITTFGTIHLTLDNDLTAISALSSTGFAVRIATDTWTQRSITTANSGRITVTNGDGVSGNPTLDLATVTNPGNGGSFVKITTDSYGRVSNSTAVTSSDITTTLGYTPVNKAGDTMSGFLTLSADPSSSLHAATKQYVDSLASGIRWKLPVIAATTVNGDLSTDFANGSVIDGITLDTGDRILIKDQSDQTQNGIYIVNASGSPTRSTDYDSLTPFDEINGAAVYVSSGMLNTGSSWVETSHVSSIGTDPIVFVQFNGLANINAGAGLTQTGNTIDVITASSSRIVVNSDSIDLATTGVIDDSYGNVAETVYLNVDAYGRITGISLVPISIDPSQAGLGNVTNDAQVKLSTVSAKGDLIVGTASATVINLAVGTNGQVLTADSTQTSGLKWATPTVGTVTSVNISTTSAGAIIVGGGPITSSGTLTVAIDADLESISALSSTGFAVRTASNTWAQRSITSGTGINVTNGTGVSGDVVVSNTGVTSVALTMPSIFTVTGSPVTTTGTLATSLNTQNTNIVFAGPSSGASAIPTFRSLVYADLPISLYVENPSSPVTPVASGSNAVAIGSNSTAAGDNSFAVGSGSNATLAGSKAYANGSFATAGDAQHGIYVLRNQTTNSTATELFMDGTSSRFVIPNNSVVMFSIYIAARRTDATGGSAGYKFEGVIKKDASAGTTAFIGTPSKSILGETNIAWDVSVSADTTNGSLKVSGTGEAGKTIRWVATISTSEVTN